MPELVIARFLARYLEMAMTTVCHVLPDEEEGTDLEQGYAALEHSSDAAVKSPVRVAPKLDFFITMDGETFAGHHYIVDLYDARHLDDVARVEQALVHAARAADATVLSTDFHHFQPNNGVSGVVVLAESHISIHTWPEAHFAAADIFMCGDARPDVAVEALREAFGAGDVRVQHIRRGPMQRAVGAARAR